MLREIAARTPRRPPGVDDDAPVATCPIASAISDGREKAGAESESADDRRKGAGEG